MPDQYGEFIGVEDVYIAEVQQDDADGYAADTPEYLAPAADITGSPAINSATQYYDNKPRVTYVSEGPTEHKIVVQGLSAEMMARLTGKYYNDANGRVYDTGEPNPPDFALMFKFNKGADGYRYYSFLKGTFAGGAEQATTKKDSIEPKTYELTYTAVTTIHKFTVNGEQKSMKRVFGDTADAAFDPTGWYTQVQTPDIASAPAAVALSSIVPADDATGVALDAEPQLTFNNAIDEESIQIIDENGALVETTKTWNAARKVLTISHTADFTADTIYRVIVSGVTDVYGQELAAAVKEFTTALA